jgi:hypothetical protein
MRKELVSGEGDEACEDMEPGAGTVDKADKPLGAAPSGVVGRRDRAKSWASSVPVAAINDMRVRCFVDESDSGGLVFCGTDWLE